MQKMDPFWQVSLLPATAAAAVAGTEKILGERKHKCDKFTWVYRDPA